MKHSNPPTLQELFDQIRELQKGDEPDENDLTIQKVMSEFKWGKGKSRKYLDRLTEKGVVKQEMIHGKGGHMTMVWRAA